MSTSFSIWIDFSPLIGSHRAIIGRDRNLLERTRHRDFDHYIWTALHERVIKTAGVDEGGPPLYLPVTASDQADTTSPHDLTTPTKPWQDPTTNETQTEVAFPSFMDNASAPPTPGMNLSPNAPPEPSPAPVKVQRPLRERTPNRQRFLGSKTTPSPPNPAADDGSSGHEVCYTGDFCPTPA